MEGITKLDGNFKVGEFVDSDFVMKLIQLGFKVYHDTFRHECADHILYVQEQPVLLIANVKIWLVEHRVTRDGFHYVGMRRKCDVVEEMFSLFTTKLSIW